MRVYALQRRYVLPSSGLLIRLRLALFANGERQFFAYLHVQKSRILHKNSLPNQEEKIAPPTLTSRLARAAVTGATDSAEQDYGRPAYHAHTIGATRAKLKSGDSSESERLLAQLGETRHGLARLGTRS